MATSTSTSTASTAFPAILAAAGARALHAVRLSPSSSSSSSSASSSSSSRSRLGAAAGAAVALAAYLALVRFLRFRRINALLRKYKGRDYDSLTDTELHELYLAAATLEFPTVGLISTQLALFRTYGIPKISQLLASTGQLCDPTVYARRYADTELAIAQFMYYPPASPEANLSIARVNWIHEHYKGKIDRDGMLYTLTVFVTEPAKYIAAYDWRPRTDLENEAAARFWHKIALKMGIADPPRSNADFCRVNADIEERRLRYDPKNREVAEAGMDLFLSRVPAPLRPLLRPALVAVLDDKLAAIMGLTPPPRALALAVRSLLVLRAWVVRHMMLPRVRPLIFSETRGGRAFRTDTTVVTYVRPTLWRRWGPAAWFAWLAGVSVVGDKGAYPEGCDVSELGPLYFVGKGKEAVAQRARELVDGNLRPPVWVD